MKTRKWPSFIIAALTILSFGACQEWGEADPPAGNQVYPTLKQVASYSFEEEALNPEEIQTFCHDNGDIPAIETDEQMGQVLHLSKGYARIFNPIQHAENAVSLTFWVKQAVPAAEAEDETAGEQDLTGALFSFENENATQRLFFTANGWLRYEGMDGTYENNNPVEAKTGLMSVGEWHYVAISVTNTGYFVYVDGLKKIEKTETSFDFSKIVKFMASVPYIYIGYGSDTTTGEMWLDDFKVYRNKITSKEWNSQRTPSGGGDEEIDYRTYITVGAEDFSSGWWTTFSDLIKFKNSAHFGFYNYGSGNGNWNNWNIVLTNGKAFGEPDYLEYFVLRSDAYGWQGGTNTADHPELLNITNDFNFDTFITDMQGAYVDLTLTRVGNVINVKAVITTESGTIYNYSASYDDTNYNVGLSETLGAFLVCDGSYFKLDAEDVYTEGESYPAGSKLVGPADCTAGWWQHFSDNYVISGDNEYPFGFIFTNNNNNGGNYNNWVLVATHGGAAGSDTEYFVIRADGYGWQYDINTNDNPELLNISHTFNWDTFVSDMQGAHVRLLFTRNENVLNMKAKTRTAAGVTLGDYTAHFDDVITPTIGLTLTVDGSCLDLLKVGYFPYANNIEK